MIDNFLFTFDIKFQKFRNAFEKALTIPNILSRLPFRYKLLTVSQKTIKTNKTNSN